MKKSTLYEIAIRIIGIYGLTMLVYQLSDIVVTAFELVTRHGNYYTESAQIGGVLEIVASLAEFIVLSIAPLYLLFRADRVVKWICKPGDDEENISIIAEPKIIYEIAIIIIGVILIIWSLPDFFLELVHYISFKMSSFPGADIRFDYLELHVAKIIVGIIAIAYANPIAAFFARRTKNIPRE